jgi:AraC-like DNA-binding protein
MPKKALIIGRKKFDRELKDVFKLQDEISLLIANQIRENFGHLEIQEHLVKESTNNISAYELFLKGRSLQLLWTPESILEAINFYDQAIEKDENFARSYYGNLQCYGLLASWGYMPYEETIKKAITYFLKAKELDTQIPEYPLSFVGRSFWGEWDFKTAHKFILQTLKMNPNHIDGLEAMAELCITLGEFKQAKTFANKLLEVDPLSANNHYTIAHIFYYQKDFKSALTHVNEALVINPKLELAHHLYMLCLIWLKKKEEFEIARKESPLAELQKILYEVLNEGLNSFPEKLLNEWTNIDNNTQLAPYELFILANTNHKELAFDLLKKYVNRRRGQIINYRQDPLLEALQSFDEFEKLHISNLNTEDIVAANQAEDKTKKIDESELKKLNQKLLTYFDEEHPYLNAQLSLNSLAEAIDIHPNKLSYLINELMGINFNEFVNEYRLKYFKKIALLPENSHLTLLGIAYDSGFNSKSVFNSFFKKSEGITPSKWLKNNQNR